MVPEIVARVVFADLNNDYYPDIVVDRHRVFLNRPSPIGANGRVFVEVSQSRTGLPVPIPGTTVVFVDLDNDQVLDALSVENVQLDDPKWTDRNRRTRWQKGRGNGTFEDVATELPTPPRPTIGVAIADLNQDGFLDMFFANSYKALGTYEAFPCDLLLSEGKGKWVHQSLPKPDIPFDDEKDLGGRPSYGAMILRLDRKTSGILSLSYGRRWNRYWFPTRDGHYEDHAPRLGIDGDQDRSGVYPEWLIELSKTRPQFPSKNEKPFRSNGNHFDSSVGDVDGDGTFDLFLSMITHAWAGPASDRSRLLFGNKLGKPMSYRESYSVDRVPNPETRDWNQGDLFAELTEINGDGDLDLLLSSGDYPDQHLRVYVQREKSFRVDLSCFAENHDGSQQISLADIDLDGRLDLAVGQTFNRLNAQQIAGRTPLMKVFHNQYSPENKSVTLRFQGDGETVNTAGIGVVVEATLSNGKRLLRQLIGVGGHAGKQHDFTVTLGTGSSSVKVLKVTWPDKKSTVNEFKDVPPGHYLVRFKGSLKAYGKPGLY